MSRQPILISLSPNTESDDIRLAAWLLTSPYRWSDYRNRVTDIAEKIAALIRQPHVTLTTSGRGALFEVLRAAGISEGDEVIIQAFTCLAVPAGIAWTGATPIYADIDENTYNLTAASVRGRITSRTKALVIQHTFGIPAPLTDLIALAREKNILVIEDLAHSLGGTYHGQPLGSFGDAAILSFGRDKTISSIFGGAVATHHNHLHEAIQHNMRPYSAPPAWWVIQQLLHPLLVNMAIPIYYTAGLGKMLLVLGQRLGLLSMAVSRAEKKGQQPRFIRYTFPSALLPLLAQQLDKLPRFTARRRAIAHRYQDVLGNTASETTGAGASWLRYPLRTQQRDVVKAAAVQQHILLGDWYTTPVAPLPLIASAITHYQAGSCATAEMVAQEIINLPTHPRLTDTDVSRIIETIKPYL